jgi:putative transposase
LILSRSERFQVLSLERCCQLLKVSRSYVLRPAGPSKEAPLWQARLEALCLEFAGYGYRRLSRQLMREGFSATESSVRLQMRRLGLQRRRRPRRTFTTDSGGFGGGSNLAKGFRPSAPGHLTYLAIPSGFAYLAVVMDAFSRRVLGWNLSLRLDASLAIEALARAMRATNLATGWIHHSDRGSQYHCREYRELVQSARGLSSFSRAGNPYDNATMESFFKTLKAEEVCLGTYESLAEASQHIQAFIDLYNSARLHSSLDYQSPEEFERLYAEQKLLAVH